MLLVVASDDGGGGGAGSTQAASQCRPTQVFSFSTCTTDQQARTDRTGANLSQRKM